MSRCWASSLGNCDQMSGEHVFSNAIFKAGCDCPVLVDGVKRIQGGKATYNAEKSNILCRKHNSLLSPLDTTIGQIAKFQADSNNENFTETLYIEGELFERWALKTIVNVATAGWAGPVKWQPSPEIARAIFGYCDVPDGLGLYSVDGIDPNHRPSGGTSFTTVNLSTPQGETIGGAYICVHGMPLFVSLHEGLVIELEKGMIPDLINEFSPRGLKHLHHPRAIAISRKKGVPVFIGISWDGYLRFSDGSEKPFPDRVD